MPALSFTVTPTSLIVAGKTFHTKQHLKDLGGKYSNGTWSLPLNADTLENRAFLESAAVLGVTVERSDAAAVRAYAKSPAGIAERKTADLAYAKSRLWTCCQAAYVMDLSRGHVGCHEHGFFVKGCLRTGD